MSIINPKSGGCSARNIFKVSRIWTAVAPRPALQTRLYEVYVNVTWRVYLPLQELGFLMWSIAVWPQQVPLNIKDILSDRSSLINSILSIIEGLKIFNWKEHWLIWPSSRRSATNNLQQGTPNLDISVFDLTVFIDPMKRGPVVLMSSTGLWTDWQRHCLDMEFEVELLTDTQG
jgi:hypothetical protein